SPKSAWRLPKMRKRPQPGEFLPVHPLMPFPLLARIDARGTPKTPERGERPTAGDRLHSKGSTSPDQRARGTTGAMGALKMRVVVPRVRPNYRTARQGDASAEWAEHGRNFLGRQAFAEDDLILAVGVEVGQDGARLVAVGAEELPERLLARPRRRLENEQPAAAAADVLFRVAEELVSCLRPLWCVRHDQPVQAPGAVGHGNRREVSEAERPAV